MRVRRLEANACSCVSMRAPVGGDVGDSGFTTLADMIKNNTCLTDINMFGAFE